MQYRLEQYEDTADFNGREQQLSQDGWWIQSVKLPLEGWKEMDCSEFSTKGLLVLWARNPRSLEE